MNAFAQLAGTSRCEDPDEPVKGAVNGVTVERATVLVPQGKINHFLDRITQYVETAGARSSATGSW
jgi:hypothetical protein